MAKPVLSKMPKVGIAIFSPKGHYLDKREKEGQIISVGDFLSKPEYEAMLPNFAIKSIETMPGSDAFGKPNVRFTSVLFEKIE